MQLTTGSTTGAAPVQSLIDRHTGCRRHCHVRCVRAGAHIGSDREDVDHLLQVVRQRPDDDDAVQQVDRQAVRRADVGAADLADAAVGRKDDDRRQRRLEGAVEVREALDVKHVDLIDEEDARHEFCDALVDVAVDDLVDLLAQLVRDLCFLRLEDLAHDRHDVLAAAGGGIGGVEVVQGHVLHHLLALVHVSLQCGRG